MIIKFLLIITFLINQLKTVIILPFERVHYRELTEENIMEELINNYIQVPFYIGEPLQKIPMILKMEQFPTFLTSEEYNKNIIKFDEKKSSSFKMINGHKGHYDTFDFTEGILSNDSLDFGKDQKKMKNFTFVLALNLTYQTQNFSGEIGLKLSSSHHSMPYTSSFINQLKSKDVIENYPFAIHYTDEDSGNFIFGNYLHNYDKNYIEDDFTSIKLGIYKNDIDWEIEFKNVTVNGTNIEDFNDGIELKIEYGFILGSKSYYEKIKSLYFDKHNNECKIGKFKGYFYYVCDKNVNLKDFPVLQFNFFEIKYNMTFEYNDLFYEFEGKKYFLIIFKEDFFKFKWVFGKPFFKKYFSFFDKEKKNIWFLST